MNVYRRTFLLDVYSIIDSARVIPCRGIVGNRRIKRCVYFRKKEKEAGAVSFWGVVGAIIVAVLILAFF